MFSVLNSWLFTRMDIFERSISERIKRSKNAVYNAVVKFKKTGTYLDAKCLVVHKKARQGMTKSLGGQQFGL